MKEHTNDYTQVFESELGKLNQNQKLAVDSMKGQLWLLPARAQEKLKY
jgi:hypothetical protein